MFCRFSSSKFFFNLGNTSSFIYNFSSSSSFLALFGIFFSLKEKDYLLVVVVVFSVIHRPISCPMIGSYFSLQMLGHLGPPYLQVQGP